MASSVGGREPTDVKVKRGAQRLAQSIQVAASAKEVLRAYDMSAKAVRSLLQPDPLLLVMNRFSSLQIYRSFVRSFSLGCFCSLTGRFAGRVEFVVVAREI
jgi:hypothetical protein